MTMRQTPLRARAGNHCRSHGPRVLASGLISSIMTMNRNSTMMAPA